MGGGLASHHHRFGGSSATLLLNKVISSRCTRGTSRMTSVRPSWSRGKMTTFNAGRSAWKLNQRQVVSGLRGWPWRGQSLPGEPRRHSQLPPPPGLTWGSRRDQACCESHPLCALRAPYVAARAEEEQGSREQATRFSPGSGAPAPCQPRVSEAPEANPALQMRESCQDRLPCSEAAEGPHCKSGKFKAPGPWTSHGQDREKGQVSTPHSHTWATSRGCNSQVSEAAAVTRRSRYQSGYSGKAHV